jgi:hypothetical protein
MSSLQIIYRSVWSTIVLAVVDFDNSSNVDTGKSRCNDGIDGSQSFANSRFDVVVVFFI